VIFAVGSAGAGIGSGDGCSGDSTVSALSIESAAVSAESVSAGAGVGSGYGSSVINSLAIENSRINAVGSSQPGIGGSGAIVFSGAPEIKSRSSLDSFPIGSASILLNAASLAAEVPNSRVFGNPPIASGASSLVLLYGAVTSPGEEPLSSLAGHFLQIGNLSFPTAGVWALRIYSTAFERSIPFNSSELSSLIVSVPSPGGYRLNVSAGATEGHLEGPTANVVFEVNGLTYFAVAHFVTSAHPSATSGDEPEVKGMNLVGIIVGTIAGVCALAAVFAAFAIFRYLKKAEAVQLERVKLLGADMGSDASAPFLA
jgi:hypothetical protein